MNDQQPPAVFDGEVPRSPRPWSKIPDDVVPKLMAMYDAGLGFREIADATGWAYGTIRNRLMAEPGFKVRKPGGWLARGRPSNAVAKLEARRAEVVTSYEVGGMSVREVAEAYDTSASTVRRALHAWGVTMRPKHLHGPRRGGSGG